MDGEQFCHIRYFTHTYFMFSRIWNTAKGNVKKELMFDLYFDPRANIWISPHHMFYFHGVWTNQTLTKNMLPNFAQKYQPIDEWILWWIYNLSLSLSGPLSVNSFHASIFSASVKTLYLFLFYLFNKVTTLVINYDVIPPS